MSDEDELNKEQSVPDSAAKEEAEEREAAERPSVEETPAEESEAPVKDDNDNEEDDDDDDFGDFNDHDDEFDDFVEEEQQTEESEPVFTGERLNCLNETTFNNSAQLQASVLSILQPITQDKKDNDSESEYQNAPPPLQHITPKAYFSERSESLWNQLAVIAPEVHPIDWKRSSIRRLLLVSLGVPLDLDEILPNKNTKRLVLPSSATTTKEDAAAAKTESESTASSATPSSKQDSAEIEQLNIETENSVSKWQQLANVSVEACEGMDEAELQSHVDNLKSAIEKGESLFQKWESKKQAAEKDKEAFEGVIESLLEYAQRLRRK
jgi:hypothetical protein